jgi:hypothetical protein
MRGFWLNMAAILTVYVMSSLIPIFRFSGEVVGEDDGRLSREACGL